jgi:cysteine desulfurase NifS
MVYGPAFRLRDRLVEPQGEARSDYLFLAGLAARLGYGHLYPQTEEDMLRHVLKGSNFSLEEVRAAGGMVRAPTVMMQYRKWQKGLLRPDGRPGFDTPSGKFEIAASILEEYGYDPLPVYTEPGESPQSRPDLAASFPLVFNSGARSSVDLHTLHHSIDALGRDKPAPTVMLNSADAAARGIAHGDRVVLATRRGRLEMYAQVSDDIMAGAIEASAMGGGPLGSAAWRRANVNELTDLKRFDPISGFPVYKALLCQVSRAGEGDAGMVAGRGEYGGAVAAAPAQKRQRIYLDHNATTPMEPVVREAMLAAAELFGNPSSLYAEGREAHNCLEEARRRLALLLNCTARRLLFTGSGSEANNLALKGMAFARPEKRHLVTSAIEHPSVLQTCRWLEGQGYEVSFLSPDDTGRVQPARLAAALRSDTLLVSVMTANNETGVIQPIRQLAAVAHAAGVPFHTDAVQAAGKIALDVQELNVDLLSLSGHKFHGPKGVGALYLQKEVAVRPLVHGGKQEHGQRAGTENLMAIAGLGQAATVALDKLPDMDRLCRLRDRLEQGIIELLPGARRVGHATDRLPNTLNLTLPGIRGESLVLALDQQGVMCSSGSACKSGSPEPSHALTAMGLSDAEAHGAVRLSLGHGNTEAEIDSILERFRHVLFEQQAMIRFVSCR